MTNELAAQLESALAPDVEAAGKAYRQIVESIAKGETEIAAIAEELGDCCTILDLTHEQAVADIESLRELDVIAKRRRAFKRTAPRLQREIDAFREKHREHKAIVRAGENGLRRMMLEIKRAGGPWSQDGADEMRQREIESNPRLFDQPEADK